MSAYREAFEAAAQRPDNFWLTAAEAIDWTVPPTRALDDSAAPHYRWFPDGQLNTCYNALDRHVEAGNGDRTALVYDSAMVGVQQSFTYADLPYFVKDGHLSPKGCEIVADAIGGYLKGSTRRR